MAEKSSELWFEEVSQCLKRKGRSVVVGCGRKAQKWVACQEWVAVVTVNTVLAWSKCLRVFVVPTEWVV